MSQNPPPVKLDSEWLSLLQNEFEQPSFLKLKSFLQEEKKQHTVYPPGSQIFSAFDLTPFSKIKAVILGQDPYHGPRQAHGLCFSVTRDVATPPSLKNIFKEIKEDIGVDQPPHGDLTEWAQQGVFLLNAILTVRQGEPTSHKDKGWEIFTDHVIRLINDKKEHVVFMLWGAYAQSKAHLIDESKHLVLKAAHPSPLARGAFFGCKHFSKCNAYLVQHGIETVNWSRK